MRHSTSFPKKTFAFDLHVLSTPPAFVLSQDQTLQFDILDRYLKRLLTKFFCKSSLNLKDALEVRYLNLVWARLLYVVIQFSRIVFTISLLKSLRLDVRDEVPTLIVFKFEVNTYFFAFC